ncbi:MAG: hypothetical protein Q9174_003486 [Haloplaca sp. 1 TL-2023]
MILLSTRNRTWLPNTPKCNRAQRGHADEPVNTANDMTVNGTPKGIGFRNKKGLLYFIDGPRERLCVAQALEKEIFRLAHDENHHGGFHRSYERLKTPRRALDIIRQGEEGDRVIDICLAGSRTEDL